MSFPRFRRPRRRAALAIECDERPWWIFHPDPDDPWYLHGFADAASLAFAAVDFPAERELLVLLDEHRRVTAVLLDPPPEVGLFVGQVEAPGLELPFCQTLSIVVEPAVHVGPPADDDRRGYFALRRAHMAQGLLLLDVILTDGDRIRSLALGCDPDPAWYDGEPAAPAGDVGAA